MSVASSSYEVDAHQQSDGRRYVRETHAATTGETFSFEYLAPAGADYAAIMTARAAAIGEQLARREFEVAVDVGA